jgi:hypothetical protein
MAHQQQELVEVEVDQVQMVLNGAAGTGGGGQVAMVVIL